MHAGECAPTAEPVAFAGGALAGAQRREPRIPHAHLLPAPTRIRGREPCGVRLRGNMAADQAGVCCEGEELERGIRHAQPWWSAAKPWPRFGLGTDYGIDTTAEKQTSGGSIFDFTPETIGGLACDLGFRIVLDGLKQQQRKLLFEVFPAHLRPEPQISAPWGNLLNAWWTFPGYRLRQRGPLGGGLAAVTSATGSVEDKRHRPDRREMYVDACDLLPRTARPAPMFLRAIWKSWPDGAARSC